MQVSISMMERQQRFSTSRLKYRRTILSLTPLGKVVFIDLSSLFVMRGWASSYLRIRFKVLLPSLRLGPTGLYGGGTTPLPPSWYAFVHLWTVLSGIPVFSAISLLDFSSLASAQIAAILVSFRSCVGPIVKRTDRMINGQVHTSRHAPYPIPHKKSLIYEGIKFKQKPALLLS